VNVSAIRPWVGTVFRLALGAVWLWAGWAKLTDPRGFVQAVRAYDATPEWLSKGIGYGLPILEVCLAALLIAGVITRVAAAVSAGLLFVFLIGIVQAAVRGLWLECGCFGGGGPTSQGSTTYTLDILRDVGLLLLAVYLIIWPMTRWSVDEYLARNDKVAMPSAKRMRSKDGARKYNALLEARKKAARERTTYLTAALGVLVVLVAFVGIAVQSNRAKIQGDVVLDHGSVQNGIAVGNPAKVTVDLFEDFQCPACLAFEQSVGPTIAADIAAGKIQARYHMLAFLDASSNGNNYSTRAANAAACASDVSVATFQKYHAILYGKDSNGQNNQPAEGSNGRTDIQLEDWGKQAGIAGDDFSTFQQCVSTQNHTAFVQAVTDNASKRNVVQTPTVQINGKELQDTSLDGFNAAVKAAGGGEPATPSPSAATSASSSASAPATPTP
jgi:protein-disulfide isomerase